MSQYLIIQTQDPFESATFDRTLKLAGDLSKAGNDVTLLLAQNGVLPARPTKASASLTALAQAGGVRVLADRFALESRGIAATDVLPGIGVTELDVVIDALAAGAKVLWH